MNTYISYGTIIVAILLVVTVLLQVRGASSGLFGSFETTFRTRRGIEKALFQLTIILGIIFVGLALANIQLA